MRAAITRRYHKNQRPLPHQSGRGDAQPINPTKAEMVKFTSILDVSGVLYPPPSPKSPRADDELGIIVLSGRPLSKRELAA
ncbi:hypothetical protein [Sphingomonas faeni]|uniref:hypothetical protein n=1 Tax=Sphingomonas faeni TaxID=185950 RepID=UPI00335488DA